VLLAGLRGGFELVVDGLGGTNLPTVHEGDVLRPVDKLLPILGCALEPMRGIL